MKPWEDIKKTLENMQQGQLRYAETVLTAQQSMAADLLVMTEVIQCLAGAQKDLNPVMEQLLSRKDEVLASTTPEIARLYALRFEHWHTRLLSAQMQRDDQP